MVTSPAGADFGTERRDRLPASVAVTVTLFGVDFFGVACPRSFPSSSPQAAKPPKPMASSASAGMLRLIVSLNVIVCVPRARLAERRGGHVDQHLADCQGREHDRGGRHPGPLRARELSSRADPEDDRDQPERKADPKSAGGKAPCDRRAGD